MRPRFDILVHRGRELLLSDHGCELHGSRLVDATLAHFALEGRGDYRLFLASFLNFEMSPGEHRWTFLFERRGLVIKRVLKWARKELKLICTLATLGDGSFDVLREGAPVNRYVRAFSVVRKLYLTAQREDFEIRAVGNPISIRNWDRWGTEERYQHCVRRFGAKLAPKALKHAGGMFIVKERTPYIPSREDPLTLGEDIFNAMVALLGDHAAADIAGVNRDDGQRLADVQFATFADYAVSKFDRVLIGSNKNGPRNRRGHRLPSKPVGISEEVRDRIHRRIDAEHARNPALPSMAMLREMLARGDMAGLRRHYVFCKPGTDEHYSYEGYHRLEVKATRKAGVFVMKNGELKPATSRWQRRALHEGEILKIYRETDDLAEIKRRKDRLTNERAHRSDQHDNYASHALYTLALEDKFERMDEAAKRREAARNGTKPATVAVAASASATAQRHANARSRNP